MEMTLACRPNIGLPDQKPHILGASVKSPSSILTVLCLLTAGFIIPACPASAQNIRVGGPCAYSDYPGTATIISVGALPKDDATQPDSTSRHCRVQFTFSPTQPIAHRLYAQDKVHELTLSGGTPPGPRYLKKYAIAPGATFAAELHLIDSGTCSPVAFTLTGIDLTDHFENSTP